MLKKFTTITTVIFLLANFVSKAQQFNVRQSAAGAPVLLANGPVQTSFPRPLTSFEIQFTGAAGGAPFAVSGGGTTVNLTAAGQWVQLAAGAGISDLIGQQFTIASAGTTILTFTLSSTATSGDIYPTISASTFLNSLFINLSLNDFGIQVGGSNIAGYTNIGANFTHIFLDQFGNVLLGAIPQGISNRQYIVHVIYLTNSAVPSQVTYSLRQTRGNFNPSLVFNNAGQLSSFQLQNSGAGSTPARTQITYAWTHQEFPLRISTDDIEFELYRITTIAQQGPFGIQQELVAKHTMNMTKIYHGSFDFGLLKSWLENPDYTFVPLQTNPTDPSASTKTIKEGNSGPRGVVTIMGTFYFSPVYLVRRLIANANGSNLPRYKIYGRNFLDDHTLFERIYPVAGVTLNDKAFQNLFFGLNWEIARGGSLFAGYHFGRVNVLRAPANFILGETTATQEQFDLWTDKAWRTEFALGLNLDLLVVTNLFRQTPAK